MKHKKKDRVNLPFNETGTIIRVDERLWGSRYYVRIRKATFNKTNQIIDFFENDLTYESQ